MAQDPESTTEALQVLETTEATAEQAEVAPVVLPPEPRTEATVEVPQLKEKISSHLTLTEDHQKVAAHDDEHVAQKETGSATELEPEAESLDKEHSKSTLSHKDHEHLGEEKGDAKGLVKDAGEGDILSEEAQKMKLKRERKESRKEAMNKRYTFGLSTERFSEKVNKEVAQEVVEEEDQEEEEGRKEEDKVQSIVSIMENFDADGDEGEARLKSKFKGLQMEGIFGAFREDDDNGGNDIFYKDPRYDNSETVSLASIKSARSTRSLVPDTIQMKADFLRNFEVPSLSDISEEHEPEPTPKLIKDTSFDALTEDTGYYADALGEDQLSSHTSSEGSSIFGYEDQDDAMAVASPKDGSSEISDLPDIISITDEGPKKIQITFQELTNSFQEIVICEQDDEEKISKREFGVDTIVQDFVEDLLLKIVTNFESQKMDAKLRLKLDKRKLLTELRAITDAYIFEKYTNEMLSTRLVEYYKRVRNSRVFAHLNEDKEQQYLERYNQALAKVDHIKLRLDKMKYNYAAQIQELNLKLDSAHNFVSFTELKLQAKMHKYLVRPDSEFLKRYVDWALRQMTAKRNEIGDMRLGLITKSNTLGHLQAKLQELENLSSTVSIQDFIIIQNDVISLEKKVEERNLDLNRMRTQYLTEVHLTHHNREKALALSDKLRHMKITLANAIQTQRSLRGNLYDLKLDRTKIREKRKELTFQGGILAMPSLMYEYDNTVAQIKESQQRVLNLRENAKALTRRISLAETSARSM
ncbi:hypothetical protein KR200_009290 [Drosophila serrata]|nr:hypothetical protein KR200_009290 [Drosophila serrata]